MDGSAVSVAVVSSRIEAELIVGMLQSHGVEATYAADDAGGQEPQLQIYGVQVFVHREDEALARRLLATPP
jgi:Putative prokaryotic signal transducing protein